MGLIHWWPLNGDTQDKITGKSGSLIGGGNVNGSGKIGKCYSSTNNASNVASSSDGILVPNCNLVGEVGNEYSFACWFKVHGTHGQYQSCIMSSGDWNQGNCWVIGFNNINTEICCPVDNFNTGKIAIGDQLDNNVWYHLATVYKDGVSTAYLNGVYVGQVNRQGIYRSYSADSCIGRDQGHGGFFPFNGDINDLRIYDHALSQAEVKELSKALVVHYTFDDMCAEPTTNVSTINGWNSYTSYFVISERTETGLKLYRPSSSTSNILALNNSAVTGNMTAGDIWTFSCYLYIDGKPYKCTQSDMSTYNYSGISYYSNDDGYYTCTFTVGAPETWIIHASMFGDVGTNVMCEIDKIQFEKKDHATLYTPSSRESMLYNETGLIQPNYKANLQLISDAGSGTYSLKCAGSTIINTPITGDITSGATISCWIKTPTYPSTNGIVFADYNSKLAFGFYGTQNAIISCGDYSAPYVSNIKSSWTNGWNHIVVTRNNSGTISCYLNGAKLSTTSSNNWSSTSGYSTIGGRYNGSYQTYFTGYVDDYRVYHTLLSDTDIQNLYKTKAYITNQGDIETHQFIESKTQAQVTSQYCFECDEIMEKLNIPGFELLDGILIEKNPYFDTGLVFSDVNTSIYVDAEVTPTNTSGNNCLAGSGNSSWNGPIMLNFCSGKMEFGTSGYSTSTEPQGQFAANERLTVQAEIYLSTQKWYKNNVQINNITQRTKTATTATFAIGTFKTPSGTVGASNSFKGYIHRFYLKYGDEVRCYLPVKRKSDNICGLYDVHTKTFLVNSGGGTVSGTASTLCDEAAIYEDQHVSGREIIEI